ncbi:hypothetical protein PRUPE_4G130900 [Prunus persica]|uniref:Uncharacterized protein n=1 Tax=Prunus persica TaxID=3760 RepID=A0A251PK08_PRUPE|nr:hypothetical protein PRUPE_4G130900 [Prunus persica]
MPESQFPESLLATYSTNNAMEISESETLICCLFHSKSNKPNTNQLLVRSSKPFNKNTHLKKTTTLPKINTKFSSMKIRRLRV